jgi:NLI interacting factor-like phosphatase
MTDQCIVLDMDETLIHSFVDLTESEEVEANQYSHLFPRMYTVGIRDVFEAKGSGIVDSILAVERPFLHQFLKYCSKRFAKVYIWSAGQYDYVNKHIRKLSKNASFHNVYTFDDCAVEKTKKDEIYHKPLEKIGLDPAKTFIVDDRVTAYLHNPANGINIPEYSPTIDALRLENTDPNSCDNCLVKLMSYFNQPAVRQATDVRLLYKNIFKEHCDDHFPANTVPCDVIGDGDCFFRSVVECLSKDSVYSHAANLRLINLMHKNKAFETFVVSKNADIHKLLSPEMLRLAVAAIYLKDTEKTDKYLEHCKSVRNVNPQTKWMESFWNQNFSSYDKSKFLQCLADKTKYWGDEAAIDTVAHTLGIKIVVWDMATKKLIYVSPKLSNHMTKINLLHNGNHYMHIEDTCFRDRLLLPVSMESFKKRQSNNALAISRNKRQRK